MNGHVIWLIWLCDIHCLLLTVITLLSLMLICTVYIYTIFYIQDLKMLHFNFIIAGIIFLSNLFNQVCVAFVYRIVSINNFQFVVPTVCFYYILRFDKETFMFIEICMMLCDDYMCFIYLHELVVQNRMFGCFLSVKPRNYTTF